MSKQVYTVTKEGIEYLCGLINKIVSTPSELISDITLATNQTMSSVKIDKIIKQCLQDANEYSNEVVNSLTHLVAKKIDFEPTLDNTTDKINTLLLYSANNDSNYTQYLRLTNELLNLGDTSLSLNEYMKEVDADTKYTLKTTTDTLTTEVNNVKSDFTTHKDDTTIHITTTERTKWDDTADKVNGEDLVKKVDIKTTLDESSTNEDVCGAKAIFDAIKANCVGKETILYEGNINATGTYNLTDDINNYDFIIINHIGKDTVNMQSTVLSKNEISKCINPNRQFMSVYGQSSYTNYINGYFDNDKIIIPKINDEYITSIVGYKFGEVTVANTITNPAPEQSYSLDEQLTGGTWIDGKPIYRKTFKIASMANNYLLDISSLNFDNILSIKGFGNSKNSGNLFMLNYTNGESIFGCSIITESKSIKFITPTEFINVHITIEYTKTID